MLLKSPKTFDLTRPAMTHLSVWENSTLQHLKGCENFHTDQTKSSRHKAMHAKQVISSDPNVDVEDYKHFLNRVALALAVRQCFDTLRNESAYVLEFQRGFLLFLWQAQILKLPCSFWSWATNTPSDQPGNCSNSPRMKTRSKGKWAQKKTSSTYSQTHSSLITKQK